MNRPHSLSWFLNRILGDDYRLAWIRIGLSGVHLARHNDYLRGFLDLKHHSWVFGPEFGPETLARAAPALRSPLWPGADLLLPWSSWLVDARTAFAWLLLFGVFPSLNALLLALVSLLVFAADRFHYTHHLWTLYFGLAFYGLGDLKFRLGQKAFRLPDKLTLVRAYVAMAYLATGVAKLGPSWLSGRELEAIAKSELVTTPLPGLLAATFSWSALACAVAALELSLPFLLALPKTRALGLLGALSLHAGIHASMRISTFGATMVVLLIAYLPELPARSTASHKWQAFLGWFWGTPSEPARTSATGLWVALGLSALSPVSARLLDTRVGSFRMFTELVRYELRLQVDGATFPRTRLVRHLGRDGARIVLLGNGLGIGETNTEMLEAALPAITRLVCEMRPNTRTVEAELLLSPLTKETPRKVQIATTCVRTTSE